MPKYRLAITSIAIAIAVAVILYIFVGPATLVADVLQNTVALVVITVFSLIILLIGTTVVLTTESEFIAAVAAIAMFLSSIVLATALPMLINRASNYFNDLLSNITKRVVGP
ncbi:MAG: hypothetical protein QW348_00310 [Ignisphaera sp.]